MQTTARRTGYGDTEAEAEAVAKRIQTAVDDLAEVVVMAQSVLRRMLP